MFWARGVFHVEDFIENIVRDYGQRRVVRCAHEGSSGRRGFRLTRGRKDQTERSAGLGDDGGRGIPDSAARAAVLRGVVSV